MTKYTTFFLAVFSFFTLCSVSADREISFEERKIFIEEYTSIAVSEMHRTGVPASITLAQFILESDWGRGELFVNANAGFGVKCKSTWNGETYFLEDDDYENKELVESCFRKYPSVEATFIDHSDFLKNRSYYEELFLLKRNDYIGWAYGLKRCQYATDADYPAKLIRIIEEYGLYSYDNELENLPVSIDLAPENIEIIAPVMISQPTIIMPVSRPVLLQSTISIPVIQPVAPAYYVVEKPVVNNTAIPAKTSRKRRIAYQVKPRHRRPVASYRP